MSDIEKDGDAPSIDVVWKELLRARMDIAELKGMLTMHFRSGEHHQPPCEPAAAAQRTILVAAGASIAALISAVGCLVMEILSHGA